MQRGAQGVTSSHPLVGLLRLGLVLALAVISFPRLVGAGSCGGYDCWRVLPKWSGQQCAYTHYDGTYVRVVDVRHWVDGTSCPVDGYNSGHGQCSGYHQHSTSGEPMPAISPWNQWQQVDANRMVCWNYNGNNVTQAGVYWMTMQTTRDWINFYQEDWLIWVKIGAPSTGDVLTLLPSSTQRYVRTGAVVGHNPGYSDAQDSNHWGTATMVSRLTSLASIWKNEIAVPGGGCGGSTIPILRINDMSLELGGIYDYNNTWAPPHDDHREGMDVDISSARQNANGVPRSWEGEFCEIAKRQGVEFSHVTLEVPPGHAPPLFPCEVKYKSGVLIHWHLDQ